ncbi:hypothetical protein PG2093B_0218 [Bifidobacterium pseudolongum subsp. globosum]|uniref:Uncharacterized protein n=1 Tax=Bifidobacterium pseudolongum subsp. globosum TaxID=1690 RepID=A0A4Q5A2D1_9BIFI|nr:hypothetical protein PG2093B_0218 [Bifidobacterium pseudolongum subsp. globosum]
MDSSVVVQLIDLDMSQQYTCIFTAMASVIPIP